MWEMFEKKLIPIEKLRFHNGTVPIPVECPVEIFSVIKQCLVVNELGRIPVEKVYAALKLVKIPSAPTV